MHVLLRNVMQLAFARHVSQTETLNLYTLIFFLSCFLFLLHLLNALRVARHLLGQASTSAKRRSLGCVLEKGSV